MKGRVLDYVSEDDSGIITDADGNRYKFNGEEWKGDSPPSRGQQVDFAVEDGQAIGIYQELSGSALAQDNKKKSTLTLWAIILGGFGAHKFYLGAWGWGIVYLLFCWTYVPLIASSVEWIRYILMTDVEFYSKLDRFQAEKKGAFGWFW